MKPIYKLGFSFMVLSIATSCAKNDILDFKTDKPESIVLQEQIDAYPALKSYLNKANNPNFKLGVALSLSDYVNKSVMYRLANRNFEEIVLGWEMKHGGVVQANGSLALDNVKKLLEAADKGGMEVYGHTLCWHANQNATYLNSLIAPTVIPNAGGPGLEPNLFTNSNFDNGSASGWGGWGNSSTRGLSAEGQGYGNTGYAYYMTNPTATNSWSAQTAFDFSTAFQNASKYKLSFYVKGTVAGSASVGLQETVSYGADDFGSFPITTEWKLVEMEVTTKKDDRKRFLFSFGNYAGTISIDNISLRRENPNAGELIVVKTPAEKEAIIGNALETWIAGMLEVSFPYVKAWDVVNEPMSDWPDPYLLKTGIGKTNLTADEFYWQDYLGKDYAVKAFNLARKYGKESDVHFINDYGLEGSLDKCKGLIQYVQYIESKGAKVDGIGTQMHISLGADRDKIAEMFRLLAATGKLIKISELDIGLGNNIKTAQATAAQYQEQSDLYKYVIEKYFELIPKNQQYGITIWSPLDSPASSSWRAGEPIGIWTEGFVRKPAYIGVAEALKDK